jgi:beta-glucosidase
VAYLQGLQRPTEGTTSSVFVLATPKHYLGLGGMSWGSSLNTNFKIDQGITKADEELLRSQYLPPFKAVVDAGALSIMAGLNTWGDTRMVFQKKLLTDVLKKELGFRGFVVSDWYGVHEGSRNIFLSTVFAVNAGVDMFMLPFDYVMFVKHMKWANRLGLISDERIDDAVGRILYAKFALSLFDADTRTVAVKEVGKDEHRLLAREAVGQSLVLLKNNDAVLPIQPQVRHIRVAGGSADNVGKQAGAWTVEWQGVDGNWLTDSTTILEGLRENAPKSVNVEFSQDGVFATKSIADIGIAVVGEKPYAEGWGDTEFPILSDEDRLAIANLQKNSKQLIVIVVSGRPLLIEQELRDSDAFVAAWLPGSEGAGVADVLFGRIPFTGTLPLPWPLKAEQLPLGAGDTTADGSVVLFERGFGLR